MIERVGPADALFRQAARDYQAGRLREAETQLEQVIVANPGRHDAHYLLGMIAYRTQRYEHAIAALRRAVKGNRKSADYHASLGTALAAVGECKEAEACYRRALVLRPADSVTHSNRGEMLHRLGERAEAEASLRRAIALDASNAGAHFNLGVLFIAAGRGAEAAERFSRAVELQPAYAEAHSNLGAALQMLDRTADAIACFRRAIELVPRNAVYHLNLSKALQQSGAPAEADAALRRAIALDASDAEAHFRLGMLLFQTGREPEAAASLARAIELQPAHAAAHSALGDVLQMLGRDEEAIGCHRRALELAPQDAVHQHHMDLAYALLAQGRLEEGWREYEEGRAGEREKAASHGFLFPYWRGEPLDGRVLLVWMEQGIGDELTFAGVLPELAARAARCVVACSPKLIGLFRRSFPDVEVISRSDPPGTQLLSAIDLQVVASSAAALLWHTPEKFPTRADYLHPAPARAAYWRERIDSLGRGLKVGFAWRSSDLSGTRALACTQIEQWGPILGTRGARFVCLQYDDCTEELARARALFGVELHAFPEVDLFNDLDEAAALTHATDLVITAPTAVSTLAAGLGVETWRMSYGMDWKTLGTTRYPWHPTLERFDRASGQPWEEIIRSLADKLAARAAGFQN